MTNDDLMHELTKAKVSTCFGLPCIALPGKLYDWYKDYLTKKYPLAQPTSHQLPGEHMIVNGTVFTPDVWRKPS